MLTKPQPTTTVHRQRVTNSETAPMLIANENRHRQIKHNLTGIAAVDLKPIGIGMCAHTAAHPVVKNPLGPVAYQVSRRIAGQRLSKPRLWVGT